jgi:hypothetical protein
MRLQQRASQPIDGYSGVSLSQRFLRAPQIETMVAHQRPHRITARAPGILAILGRIEAQVVGGDVQLHLRRRQRCEQQ